MAKINTETGVYVVIVREYERDWGNKEIDRQYYTTEDEAKLACHEVNKHNTADEAPDYYIVADYHKV